MTFDIANRSRDALPRYAVRLSPDETIARLTYIRRGHSPREALEAAIAWRDEITPRLLEELALAPVDVEARHRARPDPSTLYFLHTLSFCLLALYREPRAFSLMLDYFASDSDLAEELSGQALSGYLPAMLVRCYDGQSLPALRLMIETDAFEPMFRHDCLRAYHGLALAGHLDRTEVVAFTERQLDAIPADATYQPWYPWLALAAAELQAPALRARIEALFDRRLTTSPEDAANLHVIADKADIAAIYADRPERIAASILSEGFFENFLDRVCHWWWFQPVRPARERHALDDTLDSVFFDLPYERTEPKIGRNELCRCGSGKKFKKCCLN